MPKHTHLEPLPEDSPTLRRQVGALVWRQDQTGVQVLLITSRDTRRWIIPKGWRHKDLSRSQSAVREAFEEAGVRGQARRKLGSFTYKKLLKSPARHIDCIVDVYLVDFKKQEKTWPEQEERTVAWVSPSVAAQRVEEPELRAIFDSMRLV